MSSEQIAADDSPSAPIPGGFKPKFHWRLLGTATPVFPGFEIDICAKDPDGKPDAVWHRERARGILANHPEIRELFGHTPATAVWCIGFAVAQVVMALLAACGGGGLGSG